MTRILKRNGLDGRVAKKVNHKSRVVKALRIETCGPAQIIKTENEIVVPFVKVENKVKTNNRDITRNEES